MTINYINKAKFEKLLDTSINICKKSIESSKRREEEQLKKLEVISKAFYLMFVDIEQDFEDSLQHEDPREEL